MVEGVVEDLGVVVEGVDLGLGMFWDILDGDGEDVVVGVRRFVRVFDRVVERVVDADVDADTDVALRLAMRCVSEPFISSFFLLVSILGLSGICGLDTSYTNCSGS
jgi:hypothetical protein